MTESLFRAIIIVTLSIGALFACTTPVRDLTSAEIGKRVTVKRAAGTQTWLGPELSVSHYRSLFHGYDTVFYRLSKSISPEKPSEPLYHLLIEAHYGGTLRHYQQIRLADGSSRLATTTDHQAERCQFFNSLVYACLFRDRMSIDLSLPELASHRAMGMRLVLGSKNQDYEVIDLPGNYLDGFLGAVNAPVESRQSIRARALWIRSEKARPTVAQWQGGGVSGGVSPDQRFHQKQKPFGQRELNGFDSTPIN